MTTVMKFIEWAAIDGFDAMRSILDEMSTESQLRKIIILCRWLEK